MERMAERAAELSNGQLKLEIYHSEQLGNETQCLEQVQAGTLAVTKVSAAALGSFVRRMNVFSLPYLFRGEDHFWAVMDGKIGRELLQDLRLNDTGQPSGFHGLCYYDSGSRNFYASFPIQTVDDLAGKKFRVMNDPVAMDMVQALGASPTPISFGELYTALKQGVVDGAENNPPSFVTSRHFEICKHFAFDHHSRIPDVLIVSQTTWDQLSGQEQRWLEQAALESSEFQRKLWKEENARSIERMKQEGVTIYEVDPAEFRARTKSVRERHAAGELGELARRIAEQR